MGVPISSCSDWQCMLGMRDVGAVGVLSMVMWEASYPREMIGLARGGARDAGLVCIVLPSASLHHVMTHVASWDYSRIMQHVVLPPAVTHM